MCVTSPMFRLHPQTNITAGVLGSKCLCTGFLLQRDGEVQQQLAPVRLKLQLFPKRIVKLIIVSDARRAPIFPAGPKIIAALYPSRLHYWDLLPSWSHHSQREDCLNRKLEQTSPHLGSSTCIRGPTDVYLYLSPSLSLSLYIYIYILV